MAAVIDLDRRRLLTMTAALGLAAGTVPEALIAPAAASEAVPLRLFNPHTKERFDVQLFVGGNWNAAGLVVCDWMMRDWRQNAVVHCDRRLYAGLYVIQRYFAPREAIRLNSGYRSEQTNSMLRKRSLDEAGGRATWMTPAINSLHTKARALDFAIPGVGLDKVSNAVWALNLGGLGKYSTFIHMDTGSRRRWGR